MINYAIYNNINGKYISVGQSMSELNSLPEGCSVYYGVCDIFNQYHDVINNTPVNFPKKPEGFFEFDFDSKQWIDPRTLDECKEDKWAEIKDKRSQAEYGGFYWNNILFDSDPISQQRISGAVQLALANPNFKINWVVKDNSIIELNKEQMTDVGLTLGKFVESVFNKSQQLRIQLDNATTKEEVERINWE